MVQQQQQLPPLPQHGEDEEMEAAVEVTLLHWSQPPHSMDKDGDDDINPGSTDRAVDRDQSSRTSDNDEHSNICTCKNESNHQDSVLLITIPPIEKILLSTVGTTKEDPHMVERALKHLTILLGYDPPPYDEEDYYSSSYLGNGSGRLQHPLFSHPHPRYQSNRYAFFHEARGIPILVWTMMQWRTEPTILMHCIRALMCGLSSSYFEDILATTPPDQPTPPSLPRDNQKAAALHAVTWAMKRHPHHESLQYLACCYIQKLIESEMEDLDETTVSSSSSGRSAYWIHHAPVMVYWIVHALRQCSDAANPVGTTHTRACQALVALSRIDPDLHRLIAKAAAGHAVLITALQTT